MKKVLVLAALTMVSAQAFASKARLTSLQNAAHLTDVQLTFDQPWQTAINGELATVEFGATGGTPNAEGGFVRQWNDSYIGLYLGHQPTALVSTIDKLNFKVNTSGEKFSASKLFALNNPFNVWYGSKAGDITWGANFFYLSSDVKSGGDVSPKTGTTINVTKQKANVMGASVGATNGVWDASLIMGLAGKGQFTNGATAFDVNGSANAIAANAEVELNSKSNMTLLGGYKMDTMYYYGSYNMGSAALSLNGTEAAKADASTMTLGLVNTHAKDGVDFFYGVSYVMEQTKVKPTGGNETKIDTTKLPVIVGVEAEANSWVTLRGSITQSFPLLGSTKTDTGTGTADSNTLGESTTVSAGVGMKFNKFTLDGVLSSGTSGALKTDDIATNASLTYAF